MSMPVALHDHDHLKQLRDRARGQLAGVDEAGRGPLAGPVVAAAVILDWSSPLSGLDDSKKVGEARRESLSAQIKENAVAWAIAEASVEEINRLNILNATLLAMRRALGSLKTMPYISLIDGNRAPCDHRCYTVIKGDSWVEEISAASILAKVERDRIMRDLDRQFPQYGFARHKGYPTKAHLEALARSGISAVHRRTFGPVKRHL